MKFVVFCAFSLLLVACVHSAPVSPDAPSAPAPLPSSSEEIDEPEDMAVDAPQEPIYIAKGEVEVATYPSTRFRGTKPPPTPDAYADLDNIHLSPKLSKLYNRLANLNPDVMQSGVMKFREILLNSKSRDDFLETLWREKSDNTDTTDPRELIQFKSDLNELAEFIAEKHPKVLSWFLSAVGARPTSANAKLSFLEKFSEIDEEMSAYPVWNRYWDYWFQSTGDFIAKWG